MNSCIFCSILECKDDNKELKVNKILYEDDLLVIIPAKGTPIPGWILFVIKKHINGFAQLTESELKHVEKIIEKVKKIYLEHFHINSILLEHGSTPEGRHPKSIVHAHLHLIPFNFSKSIETELMKELQVKHINSLQDIRINNKKDYWLYCEPNGEFYSSLQVQNVTRSIFMKLVAKQIGIESQYEWRDVVTDEKILDEMITIFENNRDKLMNE